MIATFGAVVVTVAAVVAVAEAGGVAAAVSVGCAVVVGAPLFAAAVAGGGSFGPSALVGGVEVVFGSGPPLFAMTMPTPTQSAIAATAPMIILFFEPRAFASRASCSVEGEVVACATGISGLLPLTTVDATAETSEPGCEITF